MTGKIEAAKAAAERVLKIAQRNKFSIYRTADTERLLNYLRATNSKFTRGLSEQRTKETINQANKGDQHARSSVWSNIYDHVVQGERLPDILLEPFFELRNENSGHDPSKVFHRNYYIAWAVQEVTKCGFMRTRNRATRHKIPEVHSSCSIVASVFNLEEDTVEKAAAMNFPGFNGASEK